MIDSYFICATQPSNFGDLIINKMLVDELCHYGTVYVDAYGIPSEFKNILTLNPKAIDVYDTYAFTAKHIAFSNIIKLHRLLKTTNIKQLTNSPGPSFNNSFRIGTGYKLLNTFFKAHGVSVRYYGMCCAELASYSDKINGWCVDKIYFRSYSSMLYAQKHLKGKCSYIPDLSFLLSDYTVQFSHGKSNTVAVSIRDGNNRLRIIEKSVELISRFVQIGYHVVLYHQVACDADVLEELFDQCKHLNVSLRREIVWFNDLDFYANKKYIVSNRLHSLLVGAAFEAIPIALVDNDVKQSKIVDIFQSTDMPAVNVITLDDELADIDIHDMNFDVRHWFQVNSELCRSTICQSISEICS